MRIIVRPGVVLFGLALMASTLAGCTGTRTPPGDRGGPTPGATTSDRVAIYTAVLRRYLTTSDNSFGDDHRFPIAYVLDRAEPDAAEPVAPSNPAKAPVSLPVAEQHQITAALADLGPVRFVAERAEVLESVESCARVRGDGILIVLAPPRGGPDRVEVGIHGFVACLGATWFTYVVERKADGWTVTGKTGPEAIA